VVFNKKENLSNSKLDLNMRKTLVKCSIWSTALYCADTWIHYKKRSGIPLKFWNVMLEKDGEDQLDQLCEKWQTVTQSQEGKGHTTYNKTKEGSTGFVTSCIGTAFYVIEGKIKGTRRWETRHKQLVDVLKEKKLQLDRRSTRSPSVENSLGRG
jgi:hypothetical protein